MVSDYNSDITASPLLHLSKALIADSGPSIPCPFFSFSSQLDQAAGSNISSQGYCIIMVFQPNSNVFVDV